MNPLCSALTRKGDPCPNRCVTDSDRCFSHGKDAEAVRIRATQASAEARAERAEARKEAVELADYSLTERLRLEVAERRGEIVKATIDHAVANPQSQAMQIVWDRDQGRVPQPIAEGSDASDPLEAFTTEQLQAWLNGEAIADEL